MALSKEQGEAVWLRRWEAWKGRAARKHAGIYTYPSPERTREGKIRVLCATHGEFFQAPNKHMIGRGCPKCVGRGVSKRDQLEGRYPSHDWSHVPDDIGTRDVLMVRCGVHGETRSRFNRLMQRREGLSPCSKCSIEARGLKKRISFDTLKARIMAVHGDRVSLISYSGLSADKAVFACHTHGEFSAKPLDVCNGHGCPICALEVRKTWIRANLKTTPEDFVTKARGVHGDTYDYDLDTYTLTTERVRIICKEHGEFWQIARNHTTLAAGCPRCAISVSKGEDAVASFLSGLGVEVVRRERDILNGRELDIYLPEHRLGIEFNGLYWHGELHKDADYHRNKLLRAREAGIRLVMIFEDELLFKEAQVKAQLVRHVRGVDLVGARKTQIVELPWAEAKAFFDKYHLQGAGKPAKVAYALVYKGEVVSVMSFGRERFSGGSGAFEIYRYCNKDGLGVIGGLRRLVGRFLRDHKDVHKIVTYADLRWGPGVAFGRAGFSPVGETDPGYFWCKRDMRYSRQRFQKHKLEAMLEVYDPEKTEVENCHRNGYWRIYDCGMSKWELMV